MMRCQFLDQFPLHFASVHAGKTNHVPQKFSCATDLQVKVLAESFNAPYLSVCTFFQDKGSLVQFGQRLGRVTRRIGNDVVGDCTL
jgi:predicted helicase